MKYAAENIISSTVELGGKSPNIFFADLLDQEGAVETMEAAYCDGYYIQPTLLKGTNNMRVFQEEISKFPPPRVV